MKKNNLSDVLAASMDAAMNSKEYKEMFSSSSMLEKIAFNKVSEDDKSEILDEVIEERKIKAQAKSEEVACEKCKTETPEKCEKCVCVCHGKKASSNELIVKNACSDLLKISEQLEKIGFDRLAEVSLKLAEKLISEAKSKKDKKTTKETSKTTDKKTTDKKPAMSKAERMKKIREMKKRKSEKSSKKSSK